MKRTLKSIADSRVRKTSVYKTIVAITAGVFLLGVIITSLFARAMLHQNEMEYDASLNQKVIAVDSQINQRLLSYNMLLRGAAAQFAAKPAMTSADWASFSDVMQVSTRYPNIVAVAYTAFAPSNKVSELPLTPWPAGERNEYTTIVFIQPSTPANQRAIGYDMFSEPIRREAMTKARDTADIAMTKLVKLVQDGNDAPPAGVLMYLPVYRNAIAPATSEDRRDELAGYVYIALRPKDIMQDIIAQTPKLKDGVNISLVDSSGTVMYENNLAQGSGNVITSVRPVATYGQLWEVKVAGADAPLNQFYGPLGLFFAGITASLFVALVVYFTLVFRLSRISRGLIRQRLSLMRLQQQKHGDATS